VTAPLLTIVVPVRSVPTDLQASELLWAEGPDPANAGLIETLVVLDGGADSSAQLVTAAAESTGNSRAIALDVPRGPGVARNVGMDEANGEFVCFADADDLVSPRLVLEACWLARETKADAVALGYQEISMATGTAKQRLPESTELADLLWKRAAVWRFVFRKSFLQDHGIRFPELSYGEDILFLLDVAANRPQVNPLRSVAYRHRMHDEGLSGSQRDGGSCVELARRLRDRSASSPDSADRDLARVWHARVALANSQLFMQRRPRTLWSAGLDLVRSPRTAWRLARDEVRNSRRGNGQ
jgi:glycosyltransferase involved in cell wall biosynthesis